MWAADLKWRTVKLRSPKGIAKATDYYAVGTDQTVETEILRRVEDPTAAVIRRLRNRTFQLTDLERSNLAYFMALLATRVPGWRNAQEELVGRIAEAYVKLAVEHPDYFERMARRGNAGLSKKEIEEARLSALDPENYTYRESSTLSLAHMLGTAARLAKILFEMAWLFCAPPKGLHFVTCDNPVRWYDPTADPAFRFGLIFRNSILSFPISPQLCLVGSWRDHLPAFARADKATVKDLNDRVIRFAEQYIFAASKADAQEALEMRRGMEARGEAVGPPPFNVKIPTEDESIDPMLHE